MALALNGCMDITTPKKRIAGDYYLELFETTNFYIQEKGKDENGGGAEDGTVEELGWSSDLIVAKRHSVYRGDPDGWMIVDVRKHQVSGPIDEAERKMKYPAINIYPVRDAWKKL
jgi:hypothetical protein